MIAQILSLLSCAALALAQQPSLERAWNLIAQGRRPEAIQLLNGIVKANPRDADARLLLGSALMDAGQRDESIAQLTEAVRLKPDSAEAQNALGEALNTFGETPAARGPFQRAVALNPAFATAQVNLGLVLVKLGDYSAAAPHLDRAIRLLGKSPDTAYPRYLRAKVYTQQGQVEQAAADLRQAVAIQPDFAEAWSDLGEACRTLLDDAGALAALEKAVQFAPQDPVAQTRLGSELLEQRQAIEAIPHLQEAARLDPDNQSTLYLLERALRQEGHREEADAVREKLLEQLHQKDQVDQNAFKAIQINDHGVALANAGKFGQALEKYREALNLNPQHIGIRLNYASMLLRLGYWEQGVAELRRVLKADPNNRAAKQALEEALAHPPSGAP